MVDGPSEDHDLVLRARLAGQAPDIDPLVYLTECDPSELSAGDLIRAEIVGHRDYDLLARPLTTHEGRVDERAAGSREPKPSSSELRSTEANIRARTTARPLALTNPA